MALNLNVIFDRLGVPLKESIIPTNINNNIIGKAMGIATASDDEKPGLFFNLLEEGYHNIFVQMEEDTDHNKFILIRDKNRNSGLDSKFWKKHAEGMGFKMKRDEYSQEQLKLLSRLKIY